MEITIKNTIEDYQAFYEYAVKETEQGKAVGKQSYRYWQLVLILAAGLLGAINGEITKNWLSGLGAFIWFLLIFEGINLFDTRFKPIYHEGIRVFKQQLKLWSSKELQLFQIPRTIKINEECLEITSSLSNNRWQWRVIGQIDVTTDFIFIYNRTFVNVIIPKRAFPSEQSFIEFGNRIRELFEKNKDLPITVE